jgi:biotin operon repressor
MDKIINFIMNHGTRENPVSNKEICEQLNTTDVTVRNHINKARRTGIPICSCTTGYFYSTDKSDILETIDSLMHRTISVEKAISGLLTTLR